MSAFSPIQIEAIKQLGIEVVIAKGPVDRYNDVPYAIDSVGHKTFGAMLECLKADGTIKTMALYQWCGFFGRYAILERHQSE